MIQHLVGSLDAGGDSPSPISGFIAACPKLTELTIICPQQGSIEATETGYFHDPVGSVRSATSGLANACKALSDFDTFQIVHFPASIPDLICGHALPDGVRDGRVRPTLQTPREHVDGVKDLVINCLKEPETGCREGKGRKRTTVRVIELVARGSYPNLYLDSVEVEEYKV